MIIIVVDNNSIDSIIYYLIQDPDDINKIHYITEWMSLWLK